MFNVNSKRARKQGINHGKFRLMWQFSILLLLEMIQKTANKNETEKCMEAKQQQIKKSMT